MDGEAITVFLVDDHQPIVDALTALATNDSNIQVVGHSNEGLEAVRLVFVVRPNVLVLDISLPGMSGLEICRVVKQSLPTTVVLMLTMHTNEQFILGALRNGASGYVVKEAAAAEFCDAVRTVWRGGVHLGQGIPAHLVDMVRAGSVRAVSA